ncbi:MAG: HPr(Ser) kinase/phosphatase [Simkania sp.]|nr:HPr(Ser) kinase/phosphatase [Simkania sp.]MCB1074636.1 HPr(Ser) kinase/phosphatase [Simkania sp.]
MRRKPLRIQDLISDHGKTLGLFVDCPQEGMNKNISVPEIQRPGLSLTGYVKRKFNKRILLFGRIELEYLRDLASERRKERLEDVVTKDNPAVIVARGQRPPKELKEICQKLKIPLLRSGEKTMTLMSQLTLILSEVFSPIETVHGTLVEVFGIGVLIQGDSSVGKSEAALGLIERGHRLVSDDVVHLRKKDNRYLEGTGPELTRHLLEIRGIGIINIAHLYGAVSIRQSVRVEMIMDLEEWNDDHYYDRVGLEEKFKEILNLHIPSYVLPVKPGREVALLIETTVLNHRLKEMGYHSAKEFNIKLLETIAKRQRKGRLNVG